MKIEKINENQIRCTLTKDDLAERQIKLSELAYGTEKIPKVDKIVGPGNIFVATAKKLLYGVVDIDMVAGPSEILIVADKTAKPSFLAADLMSQAEHDKMASAIFLFSSGYCI